MSDKFESLEAFYSADKRRRNSNEADYGVWWTEKRQPHTYHRVSYIKATGEIYVIALPMHNKPVEVLGVVPPDNEGLFYKTLDTILQGWADKCSVPGSLDWVRGRLAEYSLVPAVSVSKT